MKKFFIKPGLRGLFSFDPETEQIDMTDYMRTNIDWTYLVPEDGILVVNDDKKSEIKVKKGDIVIQFYDRPYAQNNVIVVKSKEWKANIAAAEKYDAEMRAKRESECSDICCDSCETCSC